MRNIELVLEQVMEYVLNNLVGSVVRGPLDVSDRYETFE